MASQNRTHASDRGKAVVDIPSVPTIGTATAGPESATVEFTANVKGGAATTWTALSSPGSITGTGSSSPVTVSGLTAGTAYTFTVRGANATGNGEYSAASNSVTPTVATSFESIATVTVGAGGSSSISFSSIPSTYKHLQIRLMLKGSLTDVGIDCFTSFNSDTTSTNYYSHYLLGTGSATAAGANANRYFGAMPGTNSTNVFSSVIMDLLDYADTNKYKTGRLLYGYDMNGSGYVAMQSVLWKNTAAINAVSIASATGGNFQQYSQAALYGIKG